MSALSIRVYEYIQKSINYKFNKILNQTFSYKKVLLIDFPVIEIFIDNTAQITIKKKYTCKKVSRFHW